MSGNRWRVDRKARRLEFTGGNHEARVSGSPDEDRMSWGKIVESEYICAPERVLVTNDRSDEGDASADASLRLEEREEPLSWGQERRPQTGSKGP